MKQKILESPTQRKASEFEDRYVGPQLRTHTEGRRADVRGTRASGREEGGGEEASFTETRLPIPAGRALIEAPPAPQSRRSLAPAGAALSRAADQKAVIAPEIRSQSAEVTRAQNQPEQQARSRRERVIGPRERPSLIETEARGKGKEPESSETSDRRERMRGERG